LIRQRLVRVRVRGLGLGLELEMKTADLKKSIWNHEEGISLVQSSEGSRSKRLLASVPTQIAY
jgi:hypothetical protein